MNTFYSRLYQFRLKFSPSLVASLGLCSLQEIGLRSSSLPPRSKLQLKLVLAKMKFHLKARLGQVSAAAILMGLICVCSNFSLAQSKSTILNNPVNFLCCDSLPFDEILPFPWDFISGNWNALALDESHAELDFSFSVGRAPTGIRLLNVTVSEISGRKQSAQGIGFENRRVIESQVSSGMNIYRLRLFSVPRDVVFPKQPGNYFNSENILIAAYYPIENPKKIQYYRLYH